MKNEQKIKLFLVDDDAVFLRLLAIEFEQFPNLAYKLSQQVKIASKN